MELAAQVNRLEDALAQLATAQERSETALSGLASAQRRTEMRLDRVEEHLERLAAAQERTEARLEQLAQAQVRTEAQLQELASAQRATETQLARLVQWQQGEDGRRRGERYEREIARQALALFAGGEGGPTERALVEQRLGTVLGSHLPDVLLSTDAGSTPFLANLLWWNGDRIAVVEISRVVDDTDVNRAVERAEVLRRAGADVIPMVIGELWNDDDTRKWARAQGVAWKVGKDLSESFVAFRRLPPSGDDES
jgi:hypothetical protein